MVKRSSSASSASVGYEVSLRNATIKGSVSSQAVISASLTEPILGPTVSLALTGLADLRADSYKFGVGLTVQT